MRVKLRIKKLLCIIIPIFIFLTPILTLAITEIENDLYKIYVPEILHGTLKGFDVKGFVYDEGEKIEVSSTFHDYGYHTFLNVNGVNGEMVGELTGTFLEGLEKAYAMQYTAYDGDGWQNINGINMKMDANLVYEGRYVNVKYTLTNTTSSNAIFSLATAADAQIDGDDEAILTRINDGKNLKLATEEGISGLPVQFTLYSSGVAGATPVDNMWIGRYSMPREGGDLGYYIQYIFAENYDYPATEGYDSAFCYSWVNRSIEAGETQSFSVFMQLGDQSIEPPPTPTPTQEPSPTPEQTPLPTIEPSPTPEETPTLTPEPSPTPEITLIPTSTIEPIPTTKPISITIDDKTISEEETPVYSYRLEGVDGQELLELTDYINDKIEYSLNGTTINATIPPLEGYEFIITPGTLTKISMLDSPKTGDFDPWIIGITSLIAIASTVYIILYKNKKLLI